MTKTVLSLQDHESDNPPPSVEELATLRHVGALVADLLDEFCDIVAPGITTASINDYVLDYCAHNNVLPAPLMYRGFPAAVCTSINHVICHGLPDTRKLREGDIINIDVTLVHDGWHADASRTYAVGKIPSYARNLVDTTYQCLLAGIEQATCGNTTGDIGHAIEKLATAKGYSIVREFCGHGVGRKFHTPPNIVHFGRPGEGTKIRPGMVFTIEPMINHGSAGVRMLNDGWTAVTRDRKLSAQFEHTIYVAEDGAEIITKSRRDFDLP